MTKASTNSKCKPVLIVGEKPTLSAPSLTLSKALARLGIPFEFAAIDELMRWEWLKIVRSARAIVLVSYHAIDPYRLSQLATAVALGVPVVRWWVGSDVLNAVTVGNIGESSLRLDGIVAANVAVATHLVDELTTIGIHAKFVPSVLDSDNVTHMDLCLKHEIKPVLIYLPSKRKEFYGLKVIEPVIAANPDINFTVIGDDTHALAAYPNVESLGWVEDMNYVYPRVGCLLRVTEHDGLPRMVMESLLRGLYAIYSWPLEGCFYARTPAEIQAALSCYRATTTPNTAGRAAMLEMLRAQPDRAMATTITSVTVPVATRLNAFGLAVRARCNAVD